MENEQLKQESEKQYPYPDSKGMHIDDYNELVYKVNLLRSGFLAGAFFVSQNRDEEIGDLKEKLKYIELQKDLRHAAYLEMLAKAKKLEEIAIEFAEWINKEGYIQKNGVNNPAPRIWKLPLQPALFITQQLFDLFIESKEGKK